MRTTDNTNHAAQTLRLVWPQWQGAGRDNVSELLSEFPIGTARRGYEFGSRILDAILPRHNGPTEIVPVPDHESASTGGIESRPEILASLAAARTPSPVMMPTGSSLWAGNVRSASPPSPRFPSATVTTWP